MTIDYETLVSRNVGLVASQEALREATVLIGGCGAEGGGTAITLARMGIGALRLCDPDVFDVSNLNRQWGAHGMSDLMAVEPRMASGMRP